jgi:DNA-binding transcriptional MerR regulator
MIVPAIATPRVVPVCRPTEAVAAATPAIERGIPETAVLVIGGLTVRAGLVVTTVDRNAAGRRRYRQLDLDWIKVCTRLRATGMPIRAIRRYAELVSAGRGNEHERLALLEAHRADVVAKIAELNENLRLIDHKVDVYRGRLAAGEADRLWAPTA